MRKAIYPGTFDPFTYGHLDILERAAQNFDKVIITVLQNPTKSPLFSVKERVNMIKEVTKHLPNVEVDSFEGLLVDYAKEHDISVVIRGLRSVIDFDVEQQRAQTNYVLSTGSLDTYFLATKLEYAYLSSSAVREIAKFKGDISHCAPAYICEKIKEIFQ